ncbi:MAG: ABC transporter substrate-binding protein [Pseudomonadota bacterium]
MLKNLLRTGVVLLAVLAVPAIAAIQPLEARVKTPVGPVAEGRVTLPVITWGADIRTVYANGNQKQTAKDSIFGQLGLDFAIQRQDVFADQIKAYRSGKTPYLRATMGMLNMALESVSDDPRIKPVVIYQLSWSAGGDVLVVKSGIENAADLRGKTIAVQADGPHVDYLGKILGDAGLTFNDVSVVWTNDLTATDDTPVSAFYGNGVDAAMVIVPDALALTSGGSVGTGAEGSVKGAAILLSTKTANRIISDVYAVRADYLAAHPAQVQAFVHGLMKAQEAVAGVFANKSRDKAAYSTMLRASAEILLDTPEAVADAEGMYLDAEHTDYAANVKFFSDAHYPRGMSRLTREIQTALAPLGLASGRGRLEHANLDYPALKDGLKDVAASETPRFDAGKVAGVVAKKQQQGTLDDDELFSFEVFFKPNQKVFSADLYQSDFDRVIEYAFTYGGALITVEGHSDPMRYLKLKKKGGNQVVLRQTRQSAKNLSLSRAMAVRQAIIDYAASTQVPLDESQFAVVGHGIEAPKSGTCGSDPCAPQTEQEWRDNMRVQFRIIQVEAEAEVFQPL